MIYGTIVRNSRKSAHFQLYESPKEVICQECLKPSSLEISDYGFADDFGGVVDYRVVTRCCDSEEWIEGCSGCGEVKTVTKDGSDYFCQECKTANEE
jgi:hypothetical protein